MHWNNCSELLPYILQHYPQTCQQTICGSEVLWSIWSSCRAWSCSAPQAVVPLARKPAERWLSAMWMCAVSDACCSQQVAFGTQVFDGREWSLESVFCCPHFSLEACPVYSWTAVAPDRDAWSAYSAELKSTNSMSCWSSYLLMYGCIRELFFITVESIHFLASQLFHSPCLSLTFKSY